MKELNGMEKRSKYLSVTQVAEYLEVSKQAVNKWINEGILNVDRLPSGRIKILRADFLQYLKDHDLHIDKMYFGIESNKVVIIDDDEKILDLLKKYYPKIKILYASGYLSNVTEFSEVIVSEENFINKPYIVTKHSQKVHPLLVRESGKENE